MVTVRSRLSCILVGSLATLPAPQPLVAQNVATPDAASPQGHGFVSRQWTTTDGLPQSSINDIIQTRDGRLWLATFGGLVRFDGGTFDVLDIARLPELASNQVMSLAESPAGGIWANTLSGRMLRLVNDTVAEHLSVPNRLGPLTAALRSGPSGALFLATRVALHRYADGSWTSFSWQQGLPGNINAVEIGSDGRVWVGTEAGLAWLDGNRFRQVRDHRPPTARGVAAIHEDAAGRLWLGTPDGLAVYDAVEDQIVPARLVGPAEGIGRVSAIGEGEAGEIWIGGRFGVMHLHLDPIAPRATVMFARPSFDRRDISRIMRDQSGSTWVGTRGAGLVRLAPQRVWHLTEADGLGRREVNHVVGDGRGGAWLAGDCGGITQISFGASVDVRRLPLDRFGECATALTKDENGDLWAAFPGHIVRVPAGDDQEPRSWGEDQGMDPEVRVTELVAGPDGSIWFGYDLGGLGVLRDSSVVLFDPGGGLPAEPINSLAYDPAGELWVGQSGTVARVPLRGGEIGEPILLTREDGVPPGAIRFIRRDRRRRIWIGSYGGGIARCTLDGKAFDRLTTAQGLPDNSLSSLLEDDRDRFWLLGNRGVSVVARAVLDSVLAGSRARIDAVLFDAEDGIPEGNAGSPAAWLDAGGIAWFATIDGVVALDTNGFPWDTVVPVPRIEGVRFGGEPRDDPPPIVIEGGAREVAIRYSSSSATTPRGAAYRYRLAGQDEDWVFADAPGTARYPRVPPGTYRFELEARNEDGVWSSQPATLDFRILPVWWETAWFRWGAGLLLAAMVGAGLVRRVRNAERRTRQLELAIMERQRAEEKVRLQQRELEHVSRIAAAGELATSLAHELNQPLMSIVSNAAASDRLLSDPDIGRDMVREALGEIISEGKRAADVIKELREFLRRGSVETERLRVNQLVRDVLLLLGSEIREARADVGLDLAGDLASVEGNRVQLQQILVNLVMNALDAMRGQEGKRRLVIQTRAADPGVEILIRDSGSGLPDEGIDALFEAFVTTKSNGMGVGLAICRTLAQAHGGSIMARNRPGGGAEFLLRLPPAGGESGGTDAEDLLASVPESPTESRW